MGTGRTILKNFAAMSLGNLAARLLGLASAVYLARMLGPGDFGKINFAIAAISYFSMLAAFNLNVIGIRGIARDPSMKGVFISRILSLKIVFGSAAAALLWIFTAVSPETSEVKALIALYGLTIFTANVFAIDWVFQGLEKMVHNAVSAVIQAVVYLGLLLLLVERLGYIAVPGALFCAQAAGLLYMLAVYRRTCGPLEFAWESGGMKDLAKDALPVALSGMTSIVILNSGFTMLGMLNTKEEVGFFSAAYRLAWVFMELLIVYVSALYPAAARVHSRSPGELEGLVNKSLGAGAILVVPLVAGAIFTAAPLIESFYGPEFAPAGGALGLLLAYAGLMFACNIFMLSMWAADRQKPVAVISLIHAGMAITLHAALIPRLGAVGVAISSSVSAAAALIMYARYCRRHLGINSGAGPLLKPLAAAAVMSAVLLLIPGAGVWTRVPLGAAVYAAALLVSGGVDKEYLNAAGRLFRSGEGKEK
jgi:O-antigen/teichoic acid export membrane protein